MSSRAQKAQKLTSQDSSNSTKHARTSHDNEEYSNRRTGDGSGESDFGAAFDPEFASIGIGEFLDLDPRPTFVVTPDINFEDGIEPIFSNDALQSNYQLFKSISQNYRSTSLPTSPKVSSVEFRSWIKESTNLEKIRAPFPPSFSFCGLVWTAFTIRNQWTVVSGSGIHQETRGISGTLPLRSESPGILQSSPPKEKQLTRGQNASVPKNFGETRSASFVTPGTADWTLSQPIGELSPHVIFARSIDWASTPLGDMSTWSREFRQVANLLMANPHPCALFWGDELTVIYNKAYADGVAGRKHPGLMGTGFRGPFAEIWDTVGETFN
jgi:hypothetical protein